MEAKQVVIRAEVDRATKWAHPETKQAAALHKWTESTWRHLDTCQFETVIKANVPSVKHRGNRGTLGGPLPAHHQIVGVGGDHVAASLRQCHQGGGNHVSLHRLREIDCRRGKSFRNDGEALAWVGMTT